MVRGQGWPMQMYFWTNDYKEMEGAKKCNTKEEAMEAAQSYSDQIVLDRHSKSGRKTNAVSPFTPGLMNRQSPTNHIVCNWTFENHNHKSKSFSYSSASKTIQSREDAEVEANKYMEYARNDEATNRRGQIVSITAKDFNNLPVRVKNYTFVYQIQEKPKKSFPRRLAPIVGLTNKRLQEVLSQQQCYSFTVNANSLVLRSDRVVLKKIVGDNFMMNKKHSLLICNQHNLE